MYKVYFYLTGAMCQMSDFLLLEGSPSKPRENQVVGQFLFYLLSALQCTNFFRIDVAGATYN